MSKELELAKKLKALADKGIGGEKINAEEMLQKLLKKHNISIEDLENDNIEEFFFVIPEKLHFKILWQITKNLNMAIKCYGEFTKKLIKDYNLAGNYSIHCTNSEYIEIEAKYSFYLELFKSESEIFFSAFIQANDLGIKSDEPRQKLTDKDMRVIEMSAKVKKGNFSKQLDFKA